MRLESTRLDIINYYDKIKFAIDTHVETLLSSNLIETNSKNHFTTLNLYRDILIKQVDIILSNNLDKNQKGRAIKFCIFIPNNNNLISKYFDSENKLGKLLILNQPVNQNVIQYLRQILNTEPPSETNYSQYFSSIEDQITTMLIMSLYTNRINGELIVDLTQENKIESFRINGNYTVINENWSHAFDSLNFDLINLKALTLFNFRTFNFTMLNFQNLKELKLLDLDLNEPFEFKFKNLEKLESLEIRLHKNKLSIILGYNNFINLKNLRNLSLSNFNLRSLSAREKKNGKKTVLKRRLNTVGNRFYWVKSKCLTIQKR
ncbi:unnamed protein product [Brachionus calyciflorus]|uniref:Uncharacterized protein n=1 Tax=Brachionus calyciflorus TaxID=104777 RepID=A0A813MN42_9BILA|nr:unnamed protein product [Brachionus calyciflorus]